MLTGAYKAGFNHPLSFIENGFPLLRE